MSVLCRLPLIVVVGEFALYALVQGIKPRGKSYVKRCRRKKRARDVYQAKPLVLFGKDLHARHPQDAFSGTRNTTATGNMRALASE